MDDTRGSDALRKVHSTLINGECDLRVAPEENLFDIRMFYPLPGSLRITFYLRTRKDRLMIVWLTATDGDDYVYLDANDGINLNYCRAVEPTPAALLTVIDAAYLDLF